MIERWFDLLLTNLILFGSFGVTIFLLALPFVLMRHWYPEKLSVFSLFLVTCLGLLLASGFVFILYNGVLLMGGLGLYLMHGSL